MQIQKKIVLILISIFNIAKLIEAINPITCGVIQYYNVTSN